MQKKPKQISKTNKCPISRVDYASSCKIILSQPLLLRSLKNQTSIRFSFSYTLSTLYKGARYSVLFDLLLIIGETDPIQKVLHYPSNDELIYLTNSTITAKTTNLNQDKSLIFFSIVLRGNRECISKYLCVTISSVRTNLMVILFFKALPLQVLYTVYSTLFILRLY